MSKAIAWVLAAMLFVPVSGKAGLIFGVLNTTGTAVISLGSVDFVGNDMTINTPASSQQGGFMALEGTTATIDNITNPPDATGPITPPEADFITFLAAPNISFTFTVLLPGIDGAAGCADTPPAANQVCTPNVPSESPFNLQNTSATSSSASFNILGYEIDSSTGLTVPITGEFTTPFTNENFQQLLSTIATGGSITTSFSADFATVTPEPGTFSDLMIGAGLFALGLVFRGKFAKP